LKRKDLDDFDEIVIKLIDKINNEKELLFEINKAE
jgi:hypothetical protein